MFLSSGNFIECGTSENCSAAKGKVRRANDSTVIPCWGPEANALDFSAEHPRHAVVQVDYQILLSREHSRRGSYTILLSTNINQARLHRL